MSLSVNDRSLSFLLYQLFPQLPWDVTSLSESDILIGPFGCPDKDCCVLSYTDNDGQEVPSLSLLLIGYQPRTVFLKEALFPHEG